MVDGIAPREASDRLSIYQAKFDELWRKYQTYSGGEELFGLQVRLQQSHKLSHTLRGVDRKGWVPVPHLGTIIKR